MADIKTFFEAAAVNRASNGLLTDGSVVWEIITPEGERVATTSRRKAALELEMALNLALTEWVEGDEQDRVANC